MISQSASRKLVVGTMLATTVSGIGAADIAINFGNVTPYVIDSRNVVARSGAES
nr:hypothetical protein [Zoogloeaceae bacterium]